jgi:N-methylhydantoinase B
LIDAANGERLSIGKENGRSLRPGDLVRVETGGGGGYGPPAGRALAAIQRDLDAGYVSAAAAAHDYGVKIGDDGKARR